ncbi:MAG: hypothetical protein Tsb0021_04750 [Chlamydiales bacterium]
MVGPSRNVNFQKQLNTNDFKKQPQEEISKRSDYIKKSKNFVLKAEALQHSYKSLYVPELNTLDLKIIELSINRTEFLANKELRNPKVLKKNWKKYEDEKRSEIERLRSEHKQLRNSLNEGLEEIHRKLSFIKKMYNENVNLNGKASHLSQKIFNKEQKKEQENDQKITRKWGFFNLFSKSSKSIQKQLNNTWDKVAHNNLDAEAKSNDISNIFSNQKYSQDLLEAKILNLLFELQTAQDIEKEQVRLLEEIYRLHQTNDRLIEWLENEWDNHVVTKENAKILKNKLDFLNVNSMALYEMLENFSSLETLKKITQETVNLKKMRDEFKEKITSLEGHLSPAVLSYYQSGQPMQSFLSEGDPEWKILNEIAVQQHYYQEFMKESLNATRSPTLANAEASLENIKETSNNIELSVSAIFQVSEKIPKKKSILSRIGDMFRSSS